MRTPPRLPTALLKRFGPKNDALAGDLREAYIAGKSAWWYWSQVITAMWFSTDRIVARRSLWSSVAAIAAAVIVLELPFLGWLWSAGVSRGLLMLLYLMPQAIPIAVPVGVVIGTFYGMGEGVFPKRMSPPLLIALLSCCVASFAISGWIVPASNQAFRVIVAGRHVARGAPELTLTELRSAMVDNTVSTGETFLPSSQWKVAVNYYGRVAVSFAPLAFAMFAFSAASLLPRRRLALVVGAACAYLGYFLIEPGFTSLPPIVVAWLPNVALATVSLLIAASISSRRVRMNIE